jgi:hypothetical protein
LSCVCCTEASSWREDSSIPVDDVTVEIISLHDEQIVTYLAGWLIRKAQACDRCIDVLTERTTLSTDHAYCNQNEGYDMIRMKSYSEGCLLCPSQKVVDTVRQMETVFQTQFDAHKTSLAVGSSLMALMKKDIDFSFLFEQHPEHGLLLSDRLPKMYTTMRNFFAIKFLNRQKKSAKSKACDDRIHSRKLKKVGHT